LTIDSVLSVADRSVGDDLVRGRIVLVDVKELNGHTDTERAEVVV
jgi:hypothetical protein